MHVYVFVRPPPTHWWWQDWVQSKASWVPAGSSLDILGSLSAKLPLNQNKHGEHVSGCCKPEARAVSLAPKWSEWDQDWANTKHKSLNKLISEHPHSCDLFSLPNNSCTILYNLLASWLPHLNISDVSDFVSGPPEARDFSSTELITWSLHPSVHWKQTIYLQDSWNT